MVVKIIVQKSSTKKRKKKCIHNSRPEQFEDGNTLLTLQIYFFARKGNDEGNVSINSMSAYHHVYNT